MLYSSGQILMLARKSCDRTEALSSILLSVVGLECFFNEFHEKLTSTDIDGPKSLQDLVFLIQLRNGLIHRKPEKFDYELGHPEREYEPHQYVQYLVSRGVIQGPDSRNPPQRLSNGCQRARSRKRWRSCTAILNRHEFAG